MSLEPSAVSWIRFASRIAVSVLPVLSGPVHFFFLLCLASVLLAVLFVLAQVFCMCFALVFSLSSPLLLHRVFSRVFWLARGGLPPSVLSCSSPSLSCVWSCRCLVGSKSCTNSHFSGLILCPSRHSSLSSPNVAHVFPCQSWLVFRCGVGCGGAVGGVGGSDVGSGAFRLACSLLLVPSYRLLEPSLDHDVACMKFIRPMASGSLVTTGSSTVSCSFAGVRLGSTCCPGSLSYGAWAEGCRPHKLRRVAFGNYIYTPKAIGSADALDCCVDECCGGCYDAMDVDSLTADIGIQVAFIVDLIGLRHAGEEHSSSLPYSATYIEIDTPRKIIALTLHFKFGRRIDCVMHEHRLMVVKARRHLDQRLRRDWCLQAGRGGVGGVDHGSAPWATAPTPRTAAGQATGPIRS